MSSHTQISQFCFFVVILLLLTLLPRLLVSRCSLDPAALPFVPVAQQKRAYATLLSSSADSSVKDAYFDAVRVLVYQILHHPETRTSIDVPLLVLAAPGVSQEQKQILTAEGATVVPVQAVPGTDLLKLRLFEMTQYDRILYLSSDMLLTKPLDHIWNEAASQKVQCTRHNFSVTGTDSAILPCTYLFAAIHDSSDDLPAMGESTLNPDFWLLRPDARLFKYYQSLSTNYTSDQDILGYAHRGFGNMPPSTFALHKWTTNWPKSKDFGGACATLHDKFWRVGNAARINRRLMESWWGMQSSMEAFWSDGKV
jgi:hypothetical protein